MLTANQLTYLHNISAKIRKHIIEMTHYAKSGHPGGSMSMTDIVTFLYFNWLNIDPEQPKKADRDIFVLCKGHAAPALYSAMAIKGFFPEEELKTLRCIGSRLQGHPDMNKLPGIEMSTGSLGQGLSVSVGMSLALKLDNKKNRVYAVMGDGELQEGQVWEAMMSAAHYKCDNLCVFVDNNKQQIDGNITNVMGIEPLTDKLKAFGWEVINIDGHDFEQIESALVTADKVVGKPTVIIAATVKGKGVSFMESQLCFHGAPCNDEQKAIACSELDKKMGVCGCQE
ncbi:MAG: transketolase [Candidatus Margulisbacteria bacterium]|nr:transketolase [Candidatus Margulisiibacteriota bacterium]